MILTLQTKYSPKVGQFLVFRIIVKYGFRKRSPKLKLANSEVALNFLNQTITSLTSSTFIRTCDSRFNMKPFQLKYGEGFELGFKPRRTSLWLTHHLPLPFPLTPFVLRHIRVPLPLPLFVIG